jgi:hypothetical protein
MSDRPQKITFGELRDMGVRGVLIYCADFPRRSHRKLIAISEPKVVNGGLAFNDHGEVLMRSYLFALTAAIALSGVGIISPAAAQDYPWCLQGRDWGYPGNCQFSFYWQCEATASGTFSYCGINPRFAYARQYRGYWRGY